MYISKHQQIDQTVFFPEAFRGPKFPTETPRQSRSTDLYLFKKSEKVRRSTAPPKNLEVWTNVIFHDFFCEVSWVPFFRLRSFSGGIYGKEA